MKEWISFASLERRQLFVNSIEQIHLKCTRRWKISKYPLEHKAASTSRWNTTAGIKIVINFSKHNTRHSNWWNLVKLIKLKSYTSTTSTGSMTMMKWTNVGHYKILHPRDSNESSIFAHFSVTKQTLSRRIENSGKNSNL